MGNHLPEFRAAARRIDRRQFVTRAGAAAVLAFAANMPSAGAATARRLNPMAISENPFTLGVASGDPQPGTALLWTRLAPEPYTADSGLPAERVEVEWEVAHDELFAVLVKSGTATAHPEFHHSVRVEVAGLAADRVYYYRFRAGTWISPVGRTRTAPLAASRITELKFATLSCQAYYHGYFTAYRHLAAEDLDVVVHLGDYLYEYAVTAVGGARNYTDRRLPAHYNRETVTLQDYRLRYGLYKSDPDLMAAHAAHPFVVTWDDHETENNYADETPENDVPPEEFLLRRAAAYRAYWENQPLRTPQQPTGPDMRLYRRLHFGQLAQFDILDTRQYRSNQVQGANWQVPGPESEDPTRTMTGETQERWLLDGWQSSDATWNLLAQQVTFAQRRDVPRADFKLSMDQWDGYPASRTRVLNGAKAAGLDNLMVLTGDVHVGYGFDLKEDFDDANSRVVGTEIATTSVSSDMDGAEKPSNWSNLTSANPHMKYYNGRRGYTTFTLAEDRATVTFNTLTAVTKPGSALTEAASFVTEAGSPGLKPA
ncbi:Alkaline phosphatase D precursor [Streptomyces sp. S4.7]|uniref:alkaline phosphatase D family protein n=1 Tax=Streptomyces sp. S4.7 TaxID=2705439 RepID=UPI001396FED1|nr:alkaline phosphatase D family protein [Streptomyces sp. S4.7]QHZ00193.1 Alkaline phosphatase D precursor [Streptomyces sp. S4.7]